MRYLLIISLAGLLALLAPGVAAGASPTPVPTVSPSPSPGVTPAPLPGELRINEFLPNPIGTDTGNEWIELANVSAHDLAIGGAVVARVSGSTLVTVPASTVIKAGEVLLLNQLSGSIVNGGDTLILKVGTTELDRVTYDAGGQEGWSWSRFGATEGGWSSLPTPGIVNPADVPEDDTDDDTGAGSGSSTSATTRATAATAKASTAKSTTKAAAAKKLPKGGPSPVPYLAIPAVGMLYWYVRRRFL